MVSMLRNSLDALSRNIDMPWYEKEMTPTFNVGMK